VLIVYQTLYAQDMLHGVLSASADVNVFSWIESWIEKRGCLVKNFLVDLLHILTERLPSAAGIGSKSEF
jgi:hypothetical protein